MNSILVILRRICIRTISIYFSLDRNKQAIRRNKFTYTLLGIVGSKQNFYKAAAFLDFIFIAIILFYGFKPAARIIQPLVSGWLPQQHFADGRITKEMFAFLPGSSLSKLGRVDLEGINTLAFFDFPIAADGT